MSIQNKTFLDTIRARRAKIQEIRTELDLEDQELVVAEKVALRLQAQQEEEVSVGIDSPDFVVRNKLLAMAAPKTQAEMTLAALQFSDQVWFESSEALHASVQQRFGVEIKLHSFLPLLSNLKSKGLIVRDGSRIALTTRAGDFHEQGATALHIKEASYTNGPKG